MKTLILMRHAKSAWGDAGQADFDRCLNPRGLKDAAQMGQRLHDYLKQLNIKLDKVISSPAKRALQTSQLVCEAYGYPQTQIETQAGIYESSVNNLFHNHIHGLDETWQTAMLVGHNPGMHGLAYALSDSKTAVIDVPTCTLMIFQVQVEKWADIADSQNPLRLIDYPKSNESQRVLK